MVEAGERLDEAIQGCHVCAEQAEGSTAMLVYADELWSITTAGDIPGWFRIQTRRHSEWLWGLAPDEALGLGPLLARLSAAIRHVCSAERVYLLALGENSLHCHALLIPRMADASPDMYGPSVLGKARDLVDREQALEIAAAVQSRLAGL